MKSAKTILSTFLVIYISCSFAQEREMNCVQSAAIYHGVNPALLGAVLMVESGMDHNAVRRNSNGSYDIGIGQVNSIHLSELRQYGVDASNLLDACKGTYVSAWLLRRGFDRYGKTWFAAASYHSVTPELNLRYQQRLQKMLSSKGIDPNSAIAVQEIAITP